MDIGFQGYVRQGNERVVIISVSSPETGDVEEPDALPTYRIYGPSGAILSGTCGSLFDGSVTGATNATPIVITSADHGLNTGNLISITGVLGNTNANGVWIVTKIGDDTFSLDDSVGNGAYTSGGSWKTMCQHTISLSSSDTNIMTPGETYVGDLSWTVNDEPRIASFSMGCN